MEKAFCKEFLSSLPDLSGIYKMVGENGHILYIGKAKNLKKRISSYKNLNKQSIRIQKMLSCVEKIDFEITATEVDALILENNLIKKHKPKFNILMRDDKTFPYIYLDMDHQFPTIKKYRSKNIIQNKNIYGPFVSANVDNIIMLLYKIFKLRSCTDYEFLKRKTPCLEYHLDRCSAPCVSYITEKDYSKSVVAVRKVLSGDIREAKDILKKIMQTKSKNEDYESAIKIRDMILSLDKLFTKRINMNGDNDFLGIFLHRNWIVFSIMFYRSGSMIGTYNKTVETKPDDKIEIYIQSFIQNFYLSNKLPDRLYMENIFDGSDLTRDFLNKIHKANKFKIQKIKGYEMENIIKAAKNNAMEYFKRNTGMFIDDIYEKMAQLFKIKTEIKTIETYDNSHTFGTYSIGSMVRASKSGFETQNFRTYKIKDKEAKDDIKMMREVLQRRLKDPKIKIPDIIMVDGGKSQLNVARKVIESYNMDDKITIISMVKAAGRKDYKERIIIAKKEKEDQVLHFDKSDKVLHFLMRQRDKAHNVAITAHRRQRDKNMTKSTLDEIKGVGPQKKKILLKHFGSKDNIKKASMEDLLKVEGINQVIAKAIFDFYQ